MWREIKQFFSGSVEASAVAEAVVRETFAKGHPGERIVRTSLCADELERFVIAVHHGPTKPSQLEFYTVVKKTLEITKLEDDSAYRPKNRR